MISGIYKWTSPSGKYYIGQSVNLKKRFNDFLNFNLVYTSAGSAIDNARNKYKDAKYWTYEVLEVADVELLNDLEMQYISNLNSTDRKIGYNLTMGGDGTKGVAWGTEKQKQAIKNRRSYKGTNNPNYGKHLSDEAKERISKAKSGRKQSKEQKDKKSKKVLQYTLDNKFIKEWDSLTEAAHSVGCDKSLIMRVCQGIKKTAKGYHWKYKM